MLKKRDIFNALKERDGLVCGICKATLEQEWERYQQWVKAEGKKPHKRNSCNIDIDHIVPASVIKRQDQFAYKYGWKWSDLNNLQLTHSVCNNKKGNAH